jgi:hypothetical protein
MNVNIPHLKINQYAKVEPNIMHNFLCLQVSHHYTNCKLVMGKMVDAVRAI